ncbi:MAG: hypothetical protein HUJ80_03445 [Firmicutes bacterium]|nr:hypothetical protein [Bacillota bacterium]
MIYINQLEYPHVAYRTNMDHPEDEKRAVGGTFKMSGCGLACAMMVADRLLVKPQFGMFDAIQLSYDCGGNHTLGTDYKVFAPVFAEKLGLDLQLTSDPEAVLSCLHTGGAVVALSSGDSEGHIGLFTHGAHYILLIAQLRDGRIAVLDPSQSDEKFLEEGRLGKVCVDGNLIYTDLQNILDDFDKEKLEGLGFAGVEQFACFWKKLPGAAE